MVARRMYQRRVAEAIGVSQRAVSQQLKVAPAE
jgi:predicted transcriptional regulator